MVRERVLGAVLVGKGEVIFSRLRMDPFPLEAIFGRDGVELRRDEGIATGVLAGDLGRVDGRADEEVVPIGFLQGGG